MAGFPLNLTLGPIINGSFFTVFFFGLICMQSINYFKQFPNDIYLVKCAGRRVLQLVFTACVCQGAYTMAITDFGEILSLLYSPWGLNLGIVVGSIIEHTGQGMSLTLAALAIKLDSFPVLEERLRWVPTLLFFGDAVLDVVNSCVLCFYLKIQSRTAFSQSTLALIDRLVVYTLPRITIAGETGLSTSSWQHHMINAIQRSSDFWTAFYMAMPGSFHSALLANINNRKNLTPRTFGTSHHGPGSGTTVEFSRSVVLTRDDIDLASTPKSDADMPNSSPEAALSNPKTTRTGRSLAHVPLMTKIKRRLDIHSTPGRQRKAECGREREIWHRMAKEEGPAGALQ
ncbi:hypothetical protein B0H11DRAFT_1911236 [Mycena galericulata]|nr:hypothetical protein B0H11DRAFT_1911236 [Mycena galericulata]